MQQDAATPPVILTKTMAEFHRPPERHLAEVYGKLGNKRVQILAYFPSKAAAHKWTESVELLSAGCVDIPITVNLSVVTHIQI
jgi:hypothetical protein